MENNSDKLIKEKLGGLHMPYDPEAWAKMEAMLDKKKKRRIFFWWWLGGGMAAAVVFLLGSIYVGTHLAGEGNNGPAYLPTKVKQSAKETTTANSSGIQLKEIPLSTSVSSTTSLQANSSIQQSAEAEKKYQQQPSTTPNQLEKKSSGKNKKKTSKSISPINSQQAPTSSEPEKYSLPQYTLPNKAISTNAELLYITALKSGADLPVTSSPITPGEDDKLPVARKKVQFRLGLRIEGFASTLGRQTFSEPRFAGWRYDTIPNSLNVVPGQPPFNIDTVALYDTLQRSRTFITPGFTAGITHEIVFKNRWAVYTGLLYSRNGFKVYNTGLVADSFSRVSSYSVTTHELQIPLSLKVYPVLKNKFRFYLAAGIINHIKLKESYLVEIENLQPSPGTAFINTANAPAALYDEFSTLGVSPASTKAISGVNGSKRYYTSFYSAAGLEILRGRSNFSLEPFYYLNLQKPGGSGKMRQNFGFSAGYSYSF